LPRTWRTYARYDRATATGLERRHLKPAPLTPISLGYSCEVKYQIIRRLNALRYAGDADTLAHALQREHRPSPADRHIFDWQITPFAAVCAYLQSDFEQVFERADLMVADDGSEAIHRSLHTRHPHEFPAGEGGLTEAMIDDYYPAARSKFDYLAQRFRDHLSRPGQFLYIFKEMRSDSEVQTLIGLLSSRSPDHEVRLLLVDYEGADPSLGGLSDQVSQGWIPRCSDKPPDRAWEGDDNAWDRIFKNFDLAI